MTKGLYPLLLMIGLLAAAGCETAPAIPAPAAATSRNDTVEQRLARPARMVLTGQPLGDVLEWLRKAAGDDVRFDINWPAMRSAGALPGKPIILSIERTSIGEALRAVLNAAADRPDRIPLDYMVFDGVVHIARRGDLYSAAQQTRTYPVHSTRPYGSVDNLIKAIKDTVGRPIDWQYGTVKEMNGQLIVTTIPSNHAAIARMLRH